MGTLENWEHVIFLRKRWKVLNQKDRLTRNCVYIHQETHSHLIISQARFLVANAQAAGL